MSAADERPDAGLRRYLGVDPAVEETMRLAGLERADAQSDSAVKRHLDKKGEND